MLKIFLTGDNHIGLGYSAYEEGVAAKLRMLRVSAFQGMVDCANREKCDLFVISGDLLERTSLNDDDKRDLRQVFDILRGFNGKVALLPGNHDYYDADMDMWKFIRELLTSCHADILLLCEERPYLITLPAGEVVLYPAICTSLHSKPNENALGWIKKEAFHGDGVYRIGIAHGAVEGETIDSEGKYYMMTRSELKGIPVDAWLIGHTHVPFPRNLSETEFQSSDNILNAGTHVQTDVNCNTDGECFLIEIDEKKQVRAKKFCSGNVRFYRRELSVLPGELSAKVADAVKDYADGSVVELRISGTVTTEEYRSCDKVLEDARSRFLRLIGDCNKLGCSISEKQINAEFPETSFSANFLKALISDPKESQLAYDLLNELKIGGKKK